MVLKFFAEVPLFKLYGDIANSQPETMNLKILIIDENPLLADMISTALNVHLHQTYPALVTYVCTQKDHGHKMPKIEEVATMVNEVDIVLLSDYTCTHRSTEVLLYCGNKRVITTSPTLSGYNRFHDKASFKKPSQDPSYLDAARTLCTLIQRAVEEITPHS